MRDPAHWRVGVDIRSADIGAAGVLADVVDWEQPRPVAIPGLVRVLSSWLWQDGHHTCSWLGAVVEAQSAADAAQQAARCISDQTAAVRIATATVHATYSASSDTGLDADEELDALTIPGSAEPYVVPVQARAYARAGNRVSLAWTSGHAPLARVTVEFNEAQGTLVVGLYEHRPPLIGPLADTGELLVRVQRQVVLEVDAPLAAVPVLDRYSGTYLPEMRDVPDEDPIRPFIFVPESSGRQPDRPASG